MSTYNIEQNDAQQWKKAMAENSLSFVEDEGYGGLRCSMQRSKERHHRQLRNSFRCIAVLSSPLSADTRKEYSLGTGISITPIRSPVTPR